MNVIECAARAVACKLGEASESRRPPRTPPVRTAPTRTIWVSHSSASMATELAERLRQPDVTVLLWDGVSALPADSHGLVVADSASLQKMACGSPSARGDRGGYLTWRGGLAPGALKRVLAHVEDSLHARIDLGDLAKMAQLSACHFSRAFRQSVGAPPHRYIIARRIAVASELVAGTDRSLVDIALAVGFSDHSHFSRSFVRITGETPRAYRHRHR